MPVYLFFSKIKKYPKFTVRGKLVFINKKKTKLGFFLLPCIHLVPNNGAHPLSAAPPLLTCQSLDDNMYTRFCPLLHQYILFKMSAQIQLNISILLVGVFCM
jgi:hypothetical protein